MSKEVVEWLRDYARRCEQATITNDRAPWKKSEAEYAQQFADMIEQRFVLDSVAKLASKPNSFPPTRIHPPSALDLRRRKRAAQTKQSTR